MSRLVSPFWNHATLTFNEKSELTYETLQISGCRMTEQDTVPGTYFVLPNETIIDFSGLATFTANHSPAGPVAN